MELPHIDLPDIDLPNVELPHVDLPNVELPHVDLPHVDLPHVELPHVDLPHVELPHVELPNVDLPNVGLPTQVKPYSRMDEIPSGTASDVVVDGCLVLEGGAFRGLYTQGFLDAMMLNDLNLQCAIGVSAGALSAMSYVSGQIGHSARVNLGYRHDSRYIGAKALLHSRSPLDVGFLTEDRGVFEPLDEERFNRPERRFVAVATNCLTGEPTYFERGKCSDIMLAARASATIPLISPMVMIDDVPYLDGGCSCKIPYQWALDQGFQKILVVRTREWGYRKEAKEDTAILKVYRGYPEFARKLSVSSFAYNIQCDELEQLDAEGKLMQIAPSEPVRISNLEGDLEKLGSLYWLGYQDCLDHMDDLKAYFLG